MSLDTIQIVEWKTQDIPEDLQDDTSVESSQISSESKDDASVESTTQTDEDDDEDDNEQEANRLRFKPHEFEIQLYGKNSKNNSVCVRITDFTPFFYLLIPNFWKDSQIKCFVECLQKKTSSKEFIGWKLQKKRKFRGFTNEKKFHFLRFDFKSKRGMNSWSKIFVKEKQVYIKDHEKIRRESLDTVKNEDLMERKRYPKKIREIISHLELPHNLNSKLLQCDEALTLYESNLDPLLRFLHIQNIQPCEAVDIPSRCLLKQKRDQISFCDAEYKVSWKEVKAHIANEPLYIPQHVACFDIECTSSHGDFPLAKKDYSKVAKNLLEKGTLNLSKLTSILEKIPRQSYRGVEQVFLKKNTKWPQKKILAKYAEIVQKCIWVYQVAKKSATTKKETRMTLSEIKEQLGIKKFLSVDIVKTWCQDYYELTYKVQDIFSEDKSNPTFIFRYDSLRDPFTVVEACLNKFLTLNLPPIEGDPIIQIGTVFHQQGGHPDKMRKDRQVMLSLGGCHQFDSDVEIQCFETEKDLLLAWNKLIREADPDIITGYNIYNFDLPYLIERGEELGIHRDFSILGRCRGVKSNVIERRGKLNSKYVDIPGRIPVDLFKIVDRDFNLPSYTLDFVSSNFIRGKVSSVESNGVSIIKTDNTIGLKKGNYIKIIIHNGYTEDFLQEGKKYMIRELDKESITLTEELPVLPNSKMSWCLGKDDVSPQEIFECQKGTDEDRGKVAKYCMMDVVLCIELMNKLQILTNNMGMANVCSTPLSWIFTRGQGIKIQSLVAKECRLKRYLMPTLFPDSFPNDGYEGAIVLKPHPGMYLDDKPVVVLDYASLYPSSMQSENLSHETIITDEKWLGDDGGEELRKLGYDYVDITFDNFSYQKNKKIKNGERTVRFVQYPDDRKGIIPNILGGLLSARKGTRKKIKFKTYTKTDGSSISGIGGEDQDGMITVTDAKGEKHIIEKTDLVSVKETYSAFEQNILDGLQLAYKVTANSLYGQIGAVTSSVFFKDIAAATTATGRKQLYIAKNYIEKHFEGSKIVYGDTDSVFVLYKTVDENGVPLRGKAALKKAIELGVESEKGIRKILKSPQDLEYEKTFMPFILFSKKRYVGNKYEFDLDKYKQTSMGIVLKRRDNAPILKIIYGGVIDILLNEMNIRKATGFLRRTLREFVQGKYGLDKLIITKKLNAHYKDPERIAHKVLADRIAKRDPGNKPQVNDRIPFIYIQTKKDTKLQGDKIESPSFIEENNLSPDYNFYITNQIMKPIGQIFGLCVESIDGFKNQPDYFVLYEKNLRTRLTDEQKIEDKVKKERQKLAEEMLFADVKRVCDHQRTGSQPITSFFPG